MGIHPFLPSWVGCNHGFWFVDRSMVCICSGDNSRDIFSMHLRASFSSTLKSWWIWEFRDICHWMLNHQLFSCQNTETLLSVNLTISSVSAKGVTSPVTVLILKCLKERELCSHHSNKRNPELYPSALSHLSYKRDRKDSLPQMSSVVWSCMDVLYHI